MFESVGRLVAAVDFKTAGLKTYALLLGILLCAVWSRLHPEQLAPNEALVVIAVLASAAKATNYAGRTRATRRPRASLKPPAPGHAALALGCVLLLAGCSLGPGVREQVQELRVSFDLYRRATMPRPPATDRGVAALASTVVDGFDAIDEAARE